MKNYIFKLLWCVAFLLIPQSNNKFATQTPDILAELPKFGYAVLDRIRNGSPYPASIAFEKTLHDSLPYGTTVRIRHIASGKYYAARLNADKKWIFVADANDASDKATEFTIVRKLSSPPLRDWIGIESTITKDLTCQYAPGNRSPVGFPSTAFDDDEDKAAHWELLGSDLGKCHLKNRLSGVLMPYQGTVEVKVEKDTEQILRSPSLWGVYKPQVKYGDKVTIYSQRRKRFYRHDGDDRPLKGDIARNIAPNAQYTVTFGGKSETNGQAVLSRHDINFRNAGLNNFFVFRENDADIICYREPANNGDGRTLMRLWLRTTWNNEDINKTPANQPLRYCTDFSLQSLRDDGQDSSWNWGAARRDYWDRTANKFGWWTADDDGQIRIRHEMSIKQVFKLLNENGILSVRAGADEGSLATLNSYPVLDEEPFIYFQSLALQSAEIAYAIAQEGSLFKFENGTWTQIPSSFKFKYVDVNSAGQTVTLDNDGVPYLRQNNSWAPLDKGPGFKEISIISPREMWGLGVDGAIYSYNGESWKAQSPQGAKIVTMSASEELAVWAVDDKNRVWRYDYDAKSWAVVDAPAGNPQIKQISVRNNEMVYMIDTAEQMLYTWNGKGWNKSEQWLSTIATSAGITKKVIPGRTEMRDLTIAVTTNADGSALDPSDLSAVAFEIIDLGNGGNVPPQDSVDFEIPVRQRPTVSGSAQTSIKLEKGASLKLQPLLGKGAAWLNESFPVNNRCTVGFVAKADDQGDIQVVLGHEVNNTFDYKVVIGGAKNTQASIIQRTIQNNEPVDDVVCVIDVKENPLAAVSPGNFTPYWVTYDNGLILVGMGLPGENVFMAYRTDDPMPLVNRIGFASNKTLVEFAEIQIYGPIVTRPQDRIYYEGTETLTVPAGGSAALWTKTPLRIADQGSLGFTLKASGKTSLILAQGQDLTKPHYKITFGDDDFKKIVIYKFIKGAYVQRGSCDVVEIDGLYLSKDSEITPWVSYNNGRFIIGYGNIGNDTSFVYQDVNPLTDIREVGFTTDAPDALIKEVEIADAVQLILERSTQYARKTATSDSNIYEGDITIILPFSYRVSQVNESVKFDDMVNNTTFYAGATPQQGALYYFTLTVMPDGAPKLDWTKAPENPQEIKIKQMIVQAAASAELERQKADIMRADGERLKELARAQGDVSRAQGDSLLKIADTTATVGAKVGGALAMSDNIIIAGVGAGFAAASGTAAIITAGMSSQAYVAAAQRDLSGAESAAAAQQRALELETAAAQAKFNANIIAGQAKFAFKSHDSYVFVDAPERIPLGEAMVPEDARNNRKTAEATLRATSSLQPTTPENFERLVVMTQDVIYLLTHSYVVSDFVAQKINDIIELLITSYPTLYDSATPNPRVINSMLNLLLSAINNSFLIPAGSDQREVVYVWANKMAHQILRTSSSLRIDKCYGEYIWLPVTSDTTNELSLSFEVEGLKDAMVCFADDSSMVRNSGKELYELHFGAFDNSCLAMRLQSLGKAFKSVTKKAFASGVLNAFQPTKITITLRSGTITIQAANGTTLTWTDPYPIEGISWIGLSCWETPVTFRNITLNNRLLSGKKVAAPKAAVPDESDEKPAPAKEAAEDKAPAASAAEKRSEAEAPAKTVVKTAPKKATKGAPAAKKAASKKAAKKK